MFYMVEKGDIFSDHFSKVTKLLQNSNFNFSKVKILKQTSNCEIFDMVPGLIGNN